MSQEQQRPYIGGQAVIEGVMMRSPSSLSIVCRRKSGELVVRERALPTMTGGLRSWPLVRGVYTVVDSVRMGSRALRWSAELYESDLRAEEEAAAAAKGSAAPSSRKGGGPKGPSLTSALALGIAALVNVQGDEPPPAPLDDDRATNEPASGQAKKSSLGWLPLMFAVALFVALPQAGAEAINKLFGLGLEVTSPAFQALTGVAKLFVVVGYLLLIRQIAEVRRVFQYHGAEHKTISTYEASQPLLVENARRMTTLHARCGTTFLVMVALVSIVVFSAIGAFLPRLPGGRIVESVGFFLMKLPFLPIVAAVTFEIQRFFARYCSTGPLRALLWPGFLVQKITTAEPDEAQLEVALASLRAALWREAAVEAPEDPGDRVFSGFDKLLADPGYARA